MSVDLNDLSGWNFVEAAREGDLRPLMECLRSGDLIPRLVRHYIADELQKEAGKRFRQSKKRRRSQVVSDTILLKRIWLAKVYALDAMFVDGTDQDRHSFIHENITSISDDAACDAWATMLDRGLVDGDTIHADTVRNVRRRCKVSPRGQKTNKINPVSKSKMPTSRS